MHRTLRLPGRIVGTICGNCDTCFAVRRAPSRDVIRGCVPRPSFLFFLKGASPGGGTTHALGTCTLCLGTSRAGHPLLVTSLGRRCVSRLLRRRKVAKVGRRLCCPKCVNGGSLTALCGTTFTFLCPSLHRDFKVPVLRTVTYNAPMIANGISTVPRMTNGNTVLISPRRPRGVTSTLLHLRGSTALCRRRMGCDLRHMGLFS